MVKTAKPAANGSGKKDDDGEGSHPPDHNQLTQHEFLTYVARQKAINAEKKALSKKESMLRREIKNSGVYLGEFDRAMKDHDKLGETETVERNRQRMQFYGWLGMESVQLSLFDDIPDKKAKPSALQQSREKGLIAGMMGENRSTNPHDADTEPWQEWEKAWHEGQSNLKSQLKKQGAKL